MTLAQLKRDAKTQKMYLELTERYGDTGEKIPERLRGLRQVVDAKSYGIILVNKDGRTSDLRIEKASLVEYDKTSLAVYDGKNDFPVLKYKVFWQIT